MSTHEEFPWIIAAFTGGGPLWGMWIAACVFLLFIAIPHRPRTVSEDEDKWLECALEQFVLRPVAAVTMFTLWHVEWSMEMHITMLVWVAIITVLVVWGRRWRSS